MRATEHPHVDALGADVADDHASNDDRTDGDSECNFRNQFTCTQQGGAEDIRPAVSVDYQGSNEIQ